MPISDDATLRGFIERLIGWSDERTALYTSHDLAHAAARLGMARVSLSRWLGRRELPR
jgi:hypothetical protein